MIKWVEHPTHSAYPRAKRDSVDAACSLEQPRSLIMEGFPAAMRAPVLAEAPVNITPGARKNHLRETSDATHLTSQCDKPFSRFAPVEWILWIVFVPLYLCP